MLSTKKSAQTLVFIAFFPFMTIPTEKSGFKKEGALKNRGSDITKTNCL
jgi:hypothetical protein